MGDCWVPVWPAVFQYDSKYTCGPQDGLRTKFVSRVYTAPIERSLIGPVVLCAVGAISGIRPTSQVCRSAEVTVLGTAEDGRHERGRDEKGLEKHGEGEGSCGIA